MACKPWKVDIHRKSDGKYLGSYFFSTKPQADQWIYEWDIINRPYGLYATYSYFDVPAANNWEKERLRDMITQIELERNAKTN